MKGSKKERHERKIETPSENFFHNILLFYRQETRKRCGQGRDMHAKESIKQSHTHPKKQTTQTNEANTHSTT